MIVEEQGTGFWTRVRPPSAPRRNRVLSLIGSEPCFFFLTASYLSPRSVLCHSKIPRSFPQQNRQGGSLFLSESVPALSVLISLSVQNASGISSIRPDRRSQVLPLQPPASSAGRRRNAACRFASAPVHSPHRPPCNCFFRLPRS